MTPEQLAAENQRLKDALHDEESRWRGSIETKLDTVISKCVMCESIKNTVTGLAGTMYGDDRAGIIGIKGQVQELNETVFGDAKQSGLRDKVNEATKGVERAKGIWLFICLVALILFSVLLLYVQWRPGK
jgi:hypothetical protein